MTCAEAIAGDPHSHCTIKWSEVHALCGQAPPEGFTMESLISDVCPDACAAAPAAAGDCTVTRDCACDYESHDCDPGCMPDEGRSPMQVGAEKYGGFFGGAVVYFARDYFAKHTGANMVECVDPTHNALYVQNALFGRPMPPAAPSAPPHLPSTCIGDDDISSCCSARKHTSTTFLSTGLPDQTAYMECCERPAYYGCPNFCSDSDGATDVAACCADGPYNYDECCKNPKGPSGQCECLGREGTHVWAGGPGRIRAISVIHEVSLHSLHDAARCPF